MSDEEDPAPAGADPAVLPGLASGSLRVAMWTSVSRVTGFIRLAVVAAVLGPTFLTNTFQALNQFPELIYVALTGTVFTMLLVPPLVEHIDANDREAQERLAGGFLGVLLVALAAVSIIILVTGPLLLRAFAAGAPAHIAAEQRRVGWLLLVTMVPQIALYGVADTGEAVQYAHARYALAAAASAFENLVLIAVMVVVAVRYGSGHDLGNVSDAEVLLLGLGATAAVAVHAGAQWYGSWRVGVRLVPRAGWRDPYVRGLARRGVESLGYAGLTTLQYVLALVVANRVPGGVIAVQLALNMYSLSVALTAFPVSVAQMAGLTRLYVSGATQRFRDELVRGAALAFFIAIPASLAVVVLARPIAHALSYGQMATPRGVTLVTAALAATGLTGFGQAAWLVTSFACYARSDARAPLRASIIRTVVLSLPGFAVAFFLLRGTAVVVAVGLTITVSTLVGSLYLALALRKQLPARGERLVPVTVRDVGASLLMLGVAYPVAVGLQDALTGRAGDVVGVLTAVVVGVGVYFGVQYLWSAPELGELQQGLRELRVRPAD